MSEFSRGGGGPAPIAEGGTASVLPFNVRAPILARSANSALKNSRKIKASQMVLGIPSNESFQDMARRSQLLGIKRA